VYQSEYVRYERKGDRVVPVRVVKQWVSRELPTNDSRREPVVKRVFRTTRLSEVPWSRLTERESAPEPWVSSDRVETRERLQGLFTRGEQGEPVLQEAGFDQYFLPIGSEPLTLAQARQTLDNQLGGREPFVVIPAEDACGA